MSKENKTKKVHIKISQLKQRSKEQIKGKLGKLFLVSCISSLLAGAMGAPIYAMLLFSVILVSPALAMGMNKVYLALASGEGLKMERLLDGFDHWWAAFKVQFLSSLYKGLWSMLFVIPGIVKHFSYAMAPFIIAENPELDADDAITLSRKMMKGYKWKLFTLEFSFIGWHLLNMYTAGIASIYVSPYLSAARTNFYLTVRDAYLANEAAEEAPVVTPAVAAPVVEEPVAEAPVVEEPVVEEPAAE